MLRFLLLFVLVVIVGQAFWRLVDGIVEGVTGRPARPGGPGRAGETGRTEANNPRGIAMVRDPVCGTFVVPERAVALTDGRNRLYFCSTACRDKYQAHQAHPA